MPQPQHTAHGHIDLAVRQIEIGFAIFQQGHHGRIYLHRSAAGGIVDSLQIGDAIIGVVNIKQLMKFEQLVMDGPGLFFKGFLAFVVTDDGGDGIKYIQKGCGVFFTGRSRLGQPGEGAACQQQADQKKA